jgi:demethylmenaquinone methyltransferase/2-methoxy-6-polyprenyl-1,4-benzoquinol methylase
MANKYYKRGGERARRVGDLFSTIAPRYDLLNDLQSLGLHRHWKRRLVRMAEPRPGERALDVCCGTGDIVWLLTQQGLEVIGLDFSEPMLIQAHGRRGKHTASRPSGARDRKSTAFCRADAQVLPFPNASFDIVTIAYGLRNLAHWEVGLEEMWRVSKPGGRVLVLDFGKPPGLIWRGIYFGYLRCAVPLLGKIFCGDAQAYAYILDSLRQYPAQAGVAKKLTELGGQPVREVNLLGGTMSIHYAQKPSA